MALLNLSEAARRADVSRNTLYKHIKNGKVTVQKDAHGNQFIDSSELLRAYGKLNGSDVDDTRAEHKPVNTKNTVQSQVVELAVAQERIRHLELRLAEKEAAVAELKQQYEQSAAKTEQQYERVIKSLESQILLLEHKTPPVQPLQPSTQAPVEVHQVQHQDDKRQQALQMQAQGLSHREIAKALGIGKSTVGDWLREMRVRKAKKR